MNDSTSRRLFLSALGGTSLTLSLAYKARASKPPSPALRLVVVTDTHLGYKDSDAAEILWSRTAAEIAAIDADAVLHLGDLVDRGQEPLYAKYMEHRGKIKAPVYEIPGNHDPQELFEKYVRRPVDSVVDLQGLRLILLNDSRTDSHDGFLTPEQLAWIDSQVAEAAQRDLPVILCMHVPAHTNKHPDHGWHVQPPHGQKELYAAIARSPGCVLAMFHGHFHNGLRGWSDAGALHEICFPSALYNKDRKLEEQRAPGYNLAEFRSAYSVVTLGDGKMHIELRVVGEGPAATKELPI